MILKKIEIVIDNKIIKAIICHYKQENVINVFFLLKLIVKKIEESIKT
jgi:hypothetical protein